jgi:PrtD family type I secretion system ABC transporter
LKFFYSPIFKAVDFFGLKSIVLLSIFSNFLLLVIPIYTLQVYDRVLLSRSNDTLLFLTGGVVLTLIIIAVSDTIRSYLLVRLANNLEYKLSSSIMSSVIEISSNSGKNSIITLRDQEKIKNFLAGQHGLITIFDAPWVPIFIFIVFLIHPTLALVLAFYMATLFILTLLTDKFSAPHLKKANESATISYGKADEISRNAQIINAMGMKEAMMEHWTKSAKLTSYYQSIASDKAAFFTSLAKFVRYSQTIVLTAFGAYLAINNEMTVGGMIAANILAGKAAAPMEGIISSWKNFYATKESFLRLNEALTDEHTKKQKTKLPDVVGNISCENATFAPNKDQIPILKNITFELKAGEFLGIIGPSGSGKSTLAKMIIGLFPATDGVIKIDNADINIWEKKQLGKDIGYLSQDVVMLNGTIKENIARYQNAKDEDVIEAAIKAHAHELILKLPQGYDTIIGTAGHILSGGQRQRIGLARAFYSNPKIIVLDEPNSSLDSEGDIALTQAMRTMQQQGTTIIVIAHRPSILQNANKLVVLANGELQLFGPYQEVAARLIPQNSKNEQKS